MQIYTDFALERAIRVDNARSNIIATLSKCLNIFNKYCTMQSYLGRTNANYDRGW